ncbi:MAG: hypothetical protein ACI4P3_05435, partial [Candidatus Spyradosoma sp.]
CAQAYAPAPLPATKKSGAGAITDDERRVSGKVFCPDEKILRKAFPAISGFRIPSDSRSFKLEQSCQHSPSSDLILLFTAVQWTRKAQSSEFC